jgi:hypothetical protein
LLISSHTIIGQGINSNFPFFLVLLILLADRKSLNISSFHRGGTVEGALTP